MLRPIRYPKFKKGDIVKTDSESICNEYVYFQTTPVVDELFVMNTKDPKGIDDALLKSWELDTTKKYRIIGTLLNPERICTDRYENYNCPDYYLYLIADIETGFIVHLVEEYALRLVESEEDI